MKRLLKGIAIILFGLVLTTASIPMDKIWPGDYWMLFCVAGVITGAVGLYIALSKGEDS